MFSTCSLRSESNSGSISRSIEYLAAAALKGAPLWKLMPRRSLSSQVVSSTSLGSDAASYVSGVNVNIDGGFQGAMTTGQVDFSGMA